MKLLIPMPVDDVIEGEEGGSEAASPPWENKEDLRDTTQKVQHWIKRGYWYRAVVCYRHITQAAKSQPLNWGVIVDVKPTEGFPFVVKWVQDGKRTVHLDTELFLIYPGQSADDFDKQLQQKEMLH